MKDVYRLLELYCGIGGMRFALNAASIPIQVVAAIDVNPVTNDIYRYNFGLHDHLQKNILSFTAADLENMKLDIITMSPPCQPFTRVGLKKDIEDARSSSFLHILNIMTQLQTKPMYVVLENVQGFENSQANCVLIDTLQKCGYIYQEFLLTPQDFGIPNSRLRYYLIASLQEASFPFKVSKQILYEMPHTKEKVKFNCSNCCERSGTIKLEDCPLNHFLESNSNDNFVSYLLPDNVLSKYWSVFDIVNENSYKSCCFTKAYHRYAQGTGSVLSPLSDSKKTEIFELVSKTEDKNKQLSLLKQLRLRYFTPKEISNIMCFPKTFDFPSHIKTSQKYKSLGNSLNVFVVASLIELLIKDNYLQ